LLTEIIVDVVVVVVELSVGIGFRSRGESDGNVCWALRDVSNS
jgi:hypothetical protein